MLLITVVYCLSMCKKDVPIKKPFFCVAAVDVFNCCFFAAIAADVAAVIDIVNALLFNVLNINSNEIVPHINH